MSPRGETTGLFRHTGPGRQATLVGQANEYEGVTLRERPAVLKLHGAVSRAVRRAGEDSYVVTEDDYIECLTRTEIVKTCRRGWPGG